MEFRPRLLHICLGPSLCSAKFLILSSFVPGSPADLNTGNGTEGAMVCTSLGSLLRPLFYFLCSNLKANPVIVSDLDL